jgi:hypothetical protein
MEKEVRFVHEVHIRHQSQDMLGLVVTRYRKEGNEHSAQETETRDHHFTQFGRIDQGLFSWDFKVRDRRGEEIASVSRGFRGWGREVRIFRQILFYFWLTLLYS